MTIEEMRRRKKELGLSNKTLSERSGVPLGTLQKILSGETSSPREKTIVALTEVLMPQYSHGESSDISAPSDYTKPAYAETAMIRENAPAYNVCRRYTVQDYMNIPDDRRVELIDGEFYDMSAPTTDHQDISGYIYNKFYNFVVSNRGPCHPMISPVDVQLDCDEWTIVQPDVLVVCDKDKINRQRVFGAPDLVIEVLSPSTRKKDMTLKLWKYSNAGVREYWIIDPDRQILLQYDLSKDIIPKTYRREDTVPVLIWDGKCAISLSELFDYAEAW